MTNAHTAYARVESVSRTQRWAGLALSTATTLFLLADGLVGLLKPETIAPAMAETGFPAGLATPVSALAVICAIVYAIPRSSVLGAILISGFVGGAICTHLRIGEFGSAPQILCLVVGLAAWAGLWLRLPALRACLPTVR